MEQKPERPPKTKLYREEDVQRILNRAVELQQDHITRVDLDEIAAEVGIPPEYVAEAEATLFRDVRQTQRSAPLFERTRVVSLVGSVLAGWLVFIVLMNLLTRIAPVLYTVPVPTHALSLIAGTGLGAFFVLPLHTARRTLMWLAVTFGVLAGVLVGAGAIHPILLLPTVLGIGSVAAVWYDRLATSSQKRLLPS